ncbi:lanthionine synthetase LanC family protein [Flavobacterium sp. UBA7680]|uniref:lanthionine synthetase LanC family protein n=1 Tax=Flavobacterium sp. UBA7680 TaxID=1946559 RepID=UPI0025C26BF8|nr:lanthionine synthetase LanC family protein [Flavobacterium sp. UBA7680]
MDEVILKIESNIWQLVPDENKIGIMDGLSGIALFYYNLYEVFKNEDYKNKLLIIIDKINTLIHEEHTSATLCSGIAGYGLMLLRIKNNFIDVNEEYFTNIDLFLQCELDELASENKYDYLHGAMGIAKYFLERYKTKKNDLVIEILYKFSHEFIEKINAKFEDVVREPVFTDQHCYYLGLAHGAAGYINFLIDLKRNFKELKLDIKKPLYIISDFLMNYKRVHSSSKQFYPNLIILETDLQIEPIVSWCQGDLGISNALFNLGLYFNDNSIRYEAVELVNNVTRILSDDSGVKDYTFCHGSIGIILQYDLASSNMSINFSDSINEWSGILDQQTKKFNEFLTYYDGSYMKEVNLLNGLAGLGMGVLTLKKQSSFQWLDIFNLH